MLATIVKIVLISLFILQAASQNPSSSAPTHPTAPYIRTPTPPISTSTPPFTFRPTSPNSYSPSIDYFSPIRFAHAAWVIPTLDVRDRFGALIVEQLGYTGVTPYLFFDPFSSSSQTFYFYATGTNRLYFVKTVPNPLYSPPRTIVIGGNQNLTVLDDDPRVPKPGFAAFRIVIESPSFTPPAKILSLRLDSGQVLFSNLVYGSQTGYISLLVGFKNFQLVLQNTLPEIVILKFSVYLDSGRVYTVFIEGSDIGPPLLTAVVAYDL
eukprot:TRINITY_DN1255_c0_g1_i2.p1 TRINITY_DN1255_c0_g1~~TRINITY_DN1255_c0_g1_i2.p1  ORF type:complete len:282 (+),score=40.19 TRINITY_DN1255_c0_g1_i2:50-847(+)